MIKNNTILTVIVFTYNHESSIAKCIESIIQQKTDYSYEIHIWDDCSIDNTSAICKEYADKYPEKIKLVIQEENTFLKPYLEMQSFAAICKVSTRYFCYIDGDDYWCDEEKIQTAVNFLESHPEYIGWAHDTLEVNMFTGESRSYIHETLGFKTVTNPVRFSAEAPFFLTSSRIFRSCDYASKRVLPTDYLLYFYHFSKGPIYFHDKIMAVYVIGGQNTFHSANNNVRDMVAMFPYKLALLFDFKQDAFCTSYLKRICNLLEIGDTKYYLLLLTKKFFGLRAGWKIWFFINFVFRYGFLSMDINYIYSREKAKSISDERSKKKFDDQESESYVIVDDKKIEITYLLERKLRLQQDLQHDRQRLRKLIQITKKLNYLYFIKISIAEKSIRSSFDRKRARISKAREDLKKIKNEIN